MNWLEDHINQVGAMIVLLILVFSAGAWYIRTKVERDTFNKFSEKKVTFWEAAFTELRVDPQK